MYCPAETLFHEPKRVSIRAVSIAQKSVAVEGRVLVVEDNPITQLVTLQQLRELGCDPRAASFGNEVLESSLSQEADLILLDCHLPDMDGYEIARAIRERERRSDRRRVPIVAVTVDSYAECAERCICAGIDGHLQKPTSIGRLREILARYLD
jgi:CheY-like chemotaxis protein